MNSIWNKTLETGDQAIDAQHQELFQLVSMLDGAIDQNSRHDLEKIVSFLEEYVVHHFEEEESLMRAAFYSDLKFHQQEHQIFAARVDDLRKAFNEGIPSAKVFYAVRQIIDKLVRHILTVDIKIVGLKQKLDNEIQKSSQAV